jgi:hypothetical protein
MIPPAGAAGAGPAVMRAFVLSAVLCLLATEAAPAQTNPPLQEMQSQSSGDSLLPPSLRNMGPRPPGYGAPLSPPAAAPAPATAPAPVPAPAPALGAAPSTTGTASADDGTQSLDLQGVPPPDMTPQVPWPNKWQAGTTARLQALDKVNAQAGNLTVKVGETATFESLTITVKACLVRPPDQPADATAFLQVIDNHPDAPGFTGWMLANAPAVSMMQSPIYDIRVTGCS